MRCKCGNTEFIMLEYAWNHPEHYDGISELRCTKCNTRYGRWSGKELKDTECEKRYGGKK